MSPESRRERLFQRARFWVGLPGLLSSLLLSVSYLAPLPLCLLAAALAMIVITAVVWGIGAWQDSREDGIGYLRALGRSLREGLTVLFHLVVP